LGRKLFARPKITQGKNREVKIMTKIKLPEGFKLIRIEGETRLWIIDEIRNQHDTCDSLLEALRKIEGYLMALKKIEATELPNNYKIIPSSIDYKFTLINKDGGYISASSSFEKLFAEATKTTELDLQIQALNNGEEIEI
jgi:hypothetical protein